MSNVWPGTVAPNIPDGPTTPGIPSGGAFGWSATKDYLSYDTTTHAQGNATGPGGVPGANMGGNPTWAYQGTNWFDGVYNVINSTLTISGIPTAPTSLYLVIRPQVSGTLNLAVTGGSVIPSSVGVTAGAPLFVNLVSDDGITFFFQTPLLAPPSLKPVVPWNPSAFSAIVGNQVLSGSGGAEATIFVVEHQVTITKVGVGVGVQSGNIDLGVYDSSGVGGLPNFRLASAGSTACPATGPAALTMTTPVTLGPGYYWAIWTGDNSTVAMNFGTPPQAVRSLMPSIAWRVRDTTGGMFPLPPVAVNCSLYTADSNVVQIFAGAA